MATQKRTSARLKGQVGAHDQQLTLTADSLSTTETSSTTARLPVPPAEAPPPVNQKRPREASIAQADAVPAEQHKQAAKTRKRQGTKTMEQLAMNTMSAAAPGLVATPPPLVPARRELPDRKRQDHPGRPDLPRPKRSPEEMRSWETERMRLLERVKQLEAQQAEEIAEEERRDEMRELEEKSTAVLTLDDARAASAEPDSADSDDLAFLGTLPRVPIFMPGEDEPAYYVQTNSYSPVAKAKKTVKVAKEKGKAAAASQVKSTGKGAGRKASKAPAFATGLKPGWRTQAIGPSTSGDHTPAIGGLTDEDARASRPNSRARVSARSNRGQTSNNVITIESDSDSDDAAHDSNTSEELQEPTLLAAVKKVSRKANAPAKAPSSRRSQAMIPHTSAGIKRLPTIKAEPVDANTLPVIKPETSTNSLSSATTVAETVGSAAVDDYYISAILPTVFARWATSDNFWEFFHKKIDSTVPILQEIVDIVVPNCGYKVSISDSLFKATDRMYEKRSEIGRAALTQVKALYLTQTYADDPNAIREHVTWALHIDGPAFWQHPTPMEHTQLLHRDDPHYQKPAGFLRSDYINNIMQPLVRRMSGSRIRYDHPKGAVIIAMIAVERTFARWRAGTKGDVTLFKQKYFQKATREYGKIIDGISDNRWQGLLEAWGAPDEEELEVPEPAADIDSNALENSRRFLMPSSSPAPE
ncbi:hypothetical protein CONPUDRAFT_157447 [Coniophora puteana RWD-64-598 SS2]|uniref:Uncharacterized protein n=1 Tax=Coniophora puteana (strain RWD-64-598) TaxID=741705 RepID=A0A5M3MDW5_CONPW|nr:uncharacterized protein CONPUDRAFT_157447 [Coniophora puteana RWD-64-598 SS2]EIW77186.1 hypothetical protein CONPUDRAFT_157447 [Coniophora puteana RWD-64-598 SS2]